MTEDEARTKWCPAFRGNDHGTNRPNEIGGLGFCIGPACMAWRWHRSGSAIQFPNDEGVGFDSHGFAYRQGEPTGFCGLAGRPG